METTEFFTLAFTLACTIGPAIGFMLAVGLYAIQALGRRNFVIMIGRHDGRAKTTLSQEQAHDNK